jgi:peptidyl-prolyl cis-trans isomerase D
MLKTMRKNVKSLKPVLWIVVGTFIVSIWAIWGGAGRLGESGGANTLAIVGRQKISSDEYFQSLRQRLDAMKKQYSGLNQNLIRQLNIPEQTLGQIIQQHLLLQIAQGMGLQVTDVEVSERIKSYPALQREGKFVGYEIYKRILEYNHIPLNEFEDSLKQEILIGKAIGVLTAGITVSEDELWTNYRNQNESAKVEYLVSETSKIDLPNKPSESEMASYFAKNASRYEIPEKRVGDYIFLKSDDFKKDVKVQDAEIAKYYQDNIAQFRQPEKVRLSRIWLPFTDKDKDAVLAEARDLLKKAQGGADFAALARTYSKDDKAKAGGDWGFSDWKSLSAKETEAAGKLEQGQMSGVVETDSGAAILRVTEKTEASTKPLAEVSATIRSILEDQRARALAAERIQRIEARARKEKNLDFAAQQEGLKVASTGPLKKSQPLGNFDTAGAVSEALFGLKDKDISSPVFTYTGAGLVQLERIEPERPAKLDEVRADVEKDIVENLKKEKAKEKLLEIRDKLKDDWNLEAVKNKLEYKMVEEHKRGQYLGLIGENPEVDGLIFSLPLQKVGDPVSVEDGYAIFRVLGRKEASRADFEKNKATERDTLLEQKRNEFLVSYMAQAREDKKVRVNQELFARLTNQILSQYEGEQ